MYEAKDFCNCPKKDGDCSNCRAVMGAIKEEVEAEREACAKVAEGNLRTHHKVSGDYCDCIPDQIRART